MNAESIIRQADQAGIELFLAGDRIAARPKSKLSADLRELIKTHRQEIVRYLSANSHEPSRKLMRKLVSLALHEGIFNHGVQFDKKEIVALVPPSDWRDVANCTPEELKAWATALVLRAFRYRGKVPHGWDKVAHCAHCGPVWAEHNQDTLSCAWCDMRLAGKWFQRPGDNP